MADQQAQPAVVTTAANRYSTLEADRVHFAERAEKCAKLTIPTLYKRDVTNAANLKIKDPEQSMGARGVNNLGSKMVVSLFPMGTPFFKLNVNTRGAQVDKEMEEKVLQGLGILEKETLKDVENSGDVTLLFETLKHLIVTGNALLFVAEDGTRMYDLNKYVVSRAPNGEWVEIVVQEEVDPGTLPEDLQGKLRASGHIAAPGTGGQKYLKLYTHIKREGDRVKWHQEVLGYVVPDSDSDVPEDANPWIPLRFFRVDGENYGRSYVEMYLGDLSSLEVLSKAINEGSAAAAKVIFLVRPNGQTNPKVISQAPNLSVRTGDANDVTVLRLDKAADMRVAKEQLVTLERRLAAAFLITTDVMRDAERVTAEEIRLVAQELDTSLGGIYSLLSKELQLPYVKRRLHLLSKKAGMPKLPKAVSPAIVTGFAALGRGHDGERLLRFVEKVERVMANPAIAQKINIDELILRFAIADGIDTNGLLVPRQVQEANAADAQQQGMIEKFGPEVVKALGPAVAQQLAQGGPQDGAIPQTQGPA